MGAVPITVAPGSNNAYLDLNLFQLLNLQSSLMKLNFGLELICHLLYQRSKTIPICSRTAFKNSMTFSGMSP